MALFKKGLNSYKKVYNKEDVFEEIMNMLQNEFAGYKIIVSRNDAWDLLIIRNVMKKCVVNLGTLGMHESVRDQIMQEIFAVNIMSPEEEITPDISECAVGWTKSHLIVSDAYKLKLKLLEE